MEKKAEKRMTGAQLKEKLAQRLKRFWQSYMLPPAEAGEGAANSESGSALGAAAARGEGNAEVSKRLQEAAKGLGMALFAFLLSLAKTAFGARPLGMSLLFAASGQLPYLYGGALLSALFAKELSIAYAVAYTAALGIRLFLSRWLGSPEGKGGILREPMVLRVVSGVAILFTVGLYRIFSGGMLYYDLFATLFEMAAFAAGCILFSAAFAPSRNQALRELALCGLLCAGVFALREMRFFGFGVAPFGVFLLTLYISKTGGAFRATVFGLLGGLMYQVGYAPAFAVAGLCSGMLWRFGSVVASCASLLLCGVCGICATGFSALYGFWPDLLAATVVFLPLVKLGLLPKLPLFAAALWEDDRTAEAALLAAKKQQQSDQRLQALSEAFGELSEVFFSLSDRLRRPGIYEVRQAVEDAFAESCRKCRMRPICHGSEEMSTTDVMGKLCRHLARHGGIREDVLYGEGEESIPPWFSQRCEKLQGLIMRMKIEYAEAVEELLRRDKTETFAMDYAAMAKLLTCAVADAGEEYERDAALSEKLREAVQHLDFYAAGIAAYGGRRKCILASGVDLSRNRMGASKLREALETVCGRKLTLPQYSIKREYVTMSLSSARQFRAESVRAAFCKDGEAVNGDVIHVFESKEDYAYMLISDGMGSGREAAITSRITGVFLTKMLQGGNSKPVTLEMLNNFIRSKNTECFSTVDLLEVDLLCGKASFIKSGAAASYVLREGNLYRIMSQTMPIGITKEINAEEIKFDLQVGDVIVMMSDGVTQNIEDSLWLAELLTAEEGKDSAEGLQKLADDILQKAKAQSERSDDMTVGLMRIMAA